MEYSNQTNENKNCVLKTIILRHPSSAGLNELINKWICNGYQPVFNTFQDMEYDEGPYGIKRKKTIIMALTHSLNDTKIYTSRELFVNGKSGDAIKGKNGSKLCIAIHKKTREVFKKVEENWTDEGHAKFTELFPEGKDKKRRNN